MENDVPIPTRSATRTPFTGKSYITVYIHTGHESATQDTPIGLYCMNDGRNVLCQSHLDGYN